MGDDVVENIGGDARFEIKPKNPKLRVGVSRMTQIDRS